MTSTTWELEPRLQLIPPLLWSIEGENVGESASGSVITDLRTVYGLMMSEPHDKVTCSFTVNHAYNALNPNLHKLGVGIYYTDGTTWLTEDFVG